MNQHVGILQLIAHARAVIIATLGEGEMRETRGQYAIERRVVIAEMEITMREIARFAGLSDDALQAFMLGPIFDDPAAELEHGRYAPKEKAA